MVRIAKASWLKVVLSGMAVAIAGVGGLAGWSALDVAHSVHHVAVPVAVDAPVGTLVAVRTPDGRFTAFLVDDVSGHLDAMSVPGQVELPGRSSDASGERSTLATLRPRDASGIVGALAALGVPVSKYVGLDLSGVPAGSLLGRLASGELAIDQVLANPLSVASLVRAAAGHVYLGAGTSLTDVLLALRRTTCITGSLPVHRTGDGALSFDTGRLDAALAGLRDPRTACRAGGARSLLAASR